MLTCSSVWESGKHRACATGQKSVTRMLLKRNQWICETMMWTRTELAQLTCTCNIERYEASTNYPPVVLFVAFDARFEKGHVSVSKIDGPHLGRHLTRSHEKTKDCDFKKPHTCMRQWPFVSHWKFLSELPRGALLPLVPFVWWVPHEEW